MALDSDRDAPFVMRGKNWLNVILLGLGFLFLFSAFQTTAFVQVGGCMGEPVEVTTRGRSWSRDQ